MRFNRQGIVDFAKQLKDQVSKDDVSGGAAELAYRFFLAVFPFFIFLAALGSFIASLAGVQNPTDEIMKTIGDSLPQDSASVLRNQLDGVLSSHNGGLLTIGIIGAIWTASSGVNALMKNLNRIYDVGESRNMFVRYAIALGLTILGAGTMVLAFVVLFIGQIYGPEIAGQIGLQNTAADAFGIARWPVALLLILFAVAFMYWMAPNTDFKLKWISPGAAFFAVAWIVATFAFGIYVSNFGSYNETYGTLGGVVILMFWFYLTAFLLLLGAEINDVVARMAEEAAEEKANEEESSKVPGWLREEDHESRAIKPKPAGVAAAGVLWALALIAVLRHKAA